MATPDEWFEYQLKQFQEGKLSPPNLFDLGIGRKFPISGWEPIQLTMNQSIMRKAIDKHGIPPNALHGLPSKLARPIMIFRSRTVAGAFTLLLNGEVAGESLVAAIHFVNLQGRGRNGVIASIHHKLASSILWWIEQKDCLYAEEKSSQAWLQNSAPSNWEQYAGHLGQDQNQPEAGPSQTD